MKNSLVIIWCHIILKTFIHSLFYQTGFSRIIQKVFLFPFQLNASSVLWSAVISHFKLQYWHTNSPNCSPYISWKNQLREFDKRSKHFPWDDPFINSLYLYWCWSLLGLTCIGWVTINLGAETSSSGVSVWKESHVQ